MKKIMIVFFAVTLATTAHAQKISEDKVPAAAVSAFKAKFPHAEKVKWQMEESKDYEANFDLNKSEMSVVFDATGNWMETETEITTATLPQAVSAAVAKQFGDYKIKEASKVEKKDSDCFEVELSKGKEVIEVALTPTGEVLSKKAEGKKDKEDKD